MVTCADLQGHWCRDWIQTPGFEDRTTRVHWLQSGAWCVDLRIPLIRPNLTGKACLADLSRAGLRRLMSAEGFAGKVTVADSHCTWEHQINWHGLPGAADIGLMSFHRGALIEDGVLADYRQRWLAEPAAPLRTHHIQFQDHSGLLIENDQTFAFGLGPAPSTSSAGLIRDLENGAADADALRAHFDSLFCLGTWQGAEGVARLATNPFCEGKAVLRRADSGFDWFAVSFDGAELSGTLQAA